MGSTDADVLLPDTVLDSTPSRSDGVAADTERRYRIFTCELVSELGLCLDLPQVVMATGQSIVQRFYHRVSFLSCDPSQTAMAALFLAAKVEESTRRAQDVVTVMHNIHQKRLNVAEPPVLDPTSRLFESMKATLFFTEALILKELGYCLYSVSQLPHRYLPYYVKLLGGTSEMAQQAWAYLNDSLRLDLCVRHPADTIACAAIYMAARKCKIPLPASPPWYALLAPRSSLAELQSIGADILGLYTQPKLTWLPSLKPGSKEPAPPKLAPPDATAPAQTA